MIKSDNFTRSNREKSNIAIAILEKLYWLDGTIIISYFGGSNNIFADCNMKTSQKVPSTKINYPSKTKETKPGQLLVLCWINSGTYGTSSRTYGSPAGTIARITHFWKNRVPHFWEYGLIQDGIDWSSSGAYRFLQVAERNVTFWTHMMHIISIINKFNFGVLSKFCRHTFLVALNVIEKRCSNKF